MSSPPPEPELTLPKLLEEKFSGLKEALRKRTLLEWAVCAMGTWVLGFLLFLVWDRLLPVAPVGRLFMLGLGLSGLLLVGPVRYYFRVWRYHNKKDLTLLIKEQLPRFGDRLLGVLELRHQSSEKAHFSPALRQAALNQISQEAETIDFQDSIPRGYLKPLLCAVVPLVIIALGLAFLLPKHTENAVARYFLPFKEIPRYTVIRFQDLPEKLYVARGETAHLTARLKDHDLMPEIPVARSKVTGKRSAEVTYTDGYFLTLPPLEKEKKLTLTAGDAHATVLLIPVSRPRVTELTFTQKLPAYLELPEQEVKVESSYVEVLEDSELTLSLSASADLKAVKTTPEGSPQITGNQATFPAFTPEKREKILINLTDTYGLESSIPTTLTVQPRPDAAPTISLNAAQREVILLPHETLDLHLSGKDDYGVKEMGIAWHPVDSPQEVKSTLAQKGGPEADQVKCDFAFNPEILKIYPNSYQVYSTALDYLPERAPTQSTPLTVHLLSLEAHAEHLRQQFTVFLDDLDETYEKELSLYFQNQRLAESDPASLRTQDQSSLLKTSITGEKAQIKHITKHHGTSQELLKDSLRNTQLHRSTIKSFALLSEQLNGLVKNNLPEIRNTLEAAMDSRFSQDYAQKQLAQAVSLQKTALDDFKNAIEEARAANKRFESSTFIHRISELARKEKQYAETLWAGYASVIGMTPMELDPELRQQNEGYGNQQALIRQDLRWIEEDLRNYSSRTKQEAFQELAQEIVNSHVYNDMMEIETELQDNHRNLATTSALECARTILSWGEKLSGDLSNSAPAGGGGGGGGGGGSKEQDTEFMLRVMEIVRTQQDLRGRTRAIEQSKRLNDHE